MTTDTNIPTGRPACLCDRCKQPLSDAERSAAIVKQADAVARRYGLTLRQRDVVESVLRNRDEHGVSPTLDEIAVAMGIRKVSVWERVKACIAKGAMTDVKHKARPLRVVEVR